MSQATDTDIREIRELLLGLDKKQDAFDEKLDAFDKKLDAFDKKLDVHIATTSEQLKSMETQVTDIKVQLRSQDNRLWGFVAAVFLTVFGFISKLAFFPGGQP